MIIVRRAAKNVSKIITVSENSRHDISHYLNIPSEKIVVTYNVVGKNSGEVMAKRLMKLKMVWVLVMNISVCGQSKASREFGLSFRGIPAIEGQNKSSVGYSW